MISKANLEYAIAVDKHRNFGRAAKSCHVTQPTLSAGIAALEKSLGTTLFDREAQPVKVTDKGKLLIEQMRIALSELNKLKTISSTLETEVTGSFSLGIIPTISSYLIPLFIEQFSRQCPKLQVELHEMTTQEIVESVTRESLDVGILALPVDGPNFHSEPLYLEPFYLFANLEHSLSRKRKIRSTDIDGKDLWLLEEGHCFRNQILKACELRGKRPDIGNLKFESGSLETLKRLVAYSQGYTLIPHLAIDTDLFADSAAIVEFEPPVPSRQVGLVYRRAQLKKSAIEVLRSTIIQSLPASLVRFQNTNKTKIIGL